MIGARAAWQLLGLAATENAGAIRRAYSERLREMDVDADPDGFARLRDARDVALQLARSGEAAGTSAAEQVDVEELAAPHWRTTVSYPDYRRVAD